MLNRPTLKPHLTVFPMDGNTWGVQGGEKELMRLRLDDAHQRAVEFLVPQLDGTQSLEGIEERAGREGIETTTVRNVLEGMEKAGVLEEGEDHLLPPGEAERHRDQMLYFGRFSGAASGAVYQDKLRRAVVDVAAEGRLGRCMARQLEESGVGTVRTLTVDPAPATNGNAARRLRLDPDDVYPAGTEAGSLLVLALEAWDPARVEAVNRYALRTGTPWLLLQAPSIREATVGPLFVPGSTACYMCFEARLRSNWAFLAEYQAFQEYLRERRAGARPWGGLHAQFELTASLATLEVVRFVTGFSSPMLAGRFVSVDLFSHQTTRHEVLRVPRCPYCRPPRVESFPWSEAPLETEG